MCSFGFVLGLVLLALVRWVGKHMENWRLMELNEFKTVHNYSNGACLSFLLWLAYTIPCVKREAKQKREPSTAGSGVQLLGALSAPWCNWVGVVCCECLRRVTNFHDSNWKKSGPFPQLTAVDSVIHSSIHLVLQDKSVLVTSALAYSYALFHLIHNQSAYPPAEGVKKQRL